MLPTPLPCYGPLTIVRAFSSNNTAIPADGRGSFNFFGLASSAGAQAGAHIPRVIPCC